MVSMDNRMVSLLNKSKEATILVDYKNHNPKRLDTYKQMYKYHHNYKTQQLHPDFFPCITIAQSCNTPHNTILIPKTIYPFDHGIQN